MQDGIEGPCAQTAPVHRREDLHIANRMQPEALGNAFGHDPQELGLDVLRTVGGNDVEVTLTVLPHAAASAPD